MFWNRKPAANASLDACMVPPDMEGDAARVEVLRVWIVDGALHVAMRLPPGHDDRLWGLVVADLARHGVRAWVHAGADEAAATQAIAGGYVRHTKAMRDQPVDPARVDVHAFAQGDLPPPAAAAPREGAWEVARVWLWQQRIVVSLRPKSLGETSAWGLLCVDVMRAASFGYARQHGSAMIDALVTARRVFAREWEVPTAEIEGETLPGA